MIAKLNEIWTIFIEWIKRKLKSPFSNVVTKVILFSGVGVVASPIIEHLIFNAILKRVFGIDLGIAVPDLNAYIFGSLLILMAAAHNLIFLRLNQEYAVNIKNASSSVYRDLWVRCDKMIDDVVRLENLYTTNYKPTDNDYVSIAEESSIEFMRFLREHRPFMFTEDFYAKGSNLYKSCIYEITSCGACLIKKREQHDIGHTDYNFLLALKETKKQMKEIISVYDEMCDDVRRHIEKV